MKGIGAVLMCALCLGLPALSGAQGGPGTITTVAGGGVGDGKPATEALLRSPFGVAVDTEGNVYIADAGNHRIRRVGPDSLITTLAGSEIGGFSGDAGPAIKARLNSPGGVAVDGKGSVYIADTDNHRVRRVGPDGVITTIAGDGTGGYAGDSGAGPQARLNSPYGVAVDGKGNVYIADTDNHRIRRVGPDGVITTIAGTGTEGYSGDGKPGVQAQLNSPRGVAVDDSGNVYIADSGNARVRRIGLSGTIVTVAGGGAGNSLEDGVLALQTYLRHPRAVAVDDSGYVYIVESLGYRVRRVGPDGIIRILAGTGSEGFSGDGGRASQARFRDPTGVAVDGKGNVYIADPYNGRVRRVGPDRIVTTFAGSENFGLSGAVAATQASLNFPYRLAVDAAGNLYIPDTDRIRRLSPDGVITTVAGGGRPPTNSVGDVGPATQASLNSPTGVAVDAKGNLYIADRFNHRVRRVGADGIITTLAGTGADGFSGDGGQATQATMKLPTDVAVDSKGNVYIADMGNHRVRRVDPEGTITTFAGSALAGFSGDGGPATQAQLSDPVGVAVDVTGDVFIADAVANTVRRVGADGIIRAFEGTVGSTGTLKAPSDVAADPRGNVYIADAGNHRILRVGKDGVTQTLTFAGTKERDFSGDGGPATQARLSGPQGVAVDSRGNVLIADSGNQRIRLVAADPPLDGPWARRLTSSLTFEDTKMGGSSEKAFSAVQNSGNADLSVSGIEIEGEGAGQFKVSPTTAVVPAGGTLIITVTFAPSAAGLRSASLSIVHNAPGSPLKVLLEGKGLPIITTVAGGIAGQVSLNSPRGVSVDLNGNIYIADTGNNRIYRVTPDGAIATIGAAVAEASGVAVDGNGNVYIVSRKSSLVYRIGPDGVQKTFAGGGLAGSGAATNVRLYSPRGVAVNQAGAVYIADTASNRIRVVGTDGVIRDFAGINDSSGGFSGDGLRATEARLREPSGVAVDRSGNVYIADTGNNRIRRVGTDGRIQTLAGGGTVLGDGGKAREARLSSPKGVAVDAQGSVYIADTGNHRIRRVGSDGIITTAAGAGGNGFSGDGGAATQALLSGPEGVAVDIQGNVYIADTGNHRVRRLGMVNPSAVSGTSVSLSVTSLAFDSTKVGSQSQKTVTITNLGTASLFLADIRVTGTNASEFKASPVSGSVEAGKSLTVTVTFSPASAGEKSATLSVAHNAGGSPAAVQLRGAGKGRLEVGPGIIATFAGTGTSGFSGDGGAATQADIASPPGVTVGPDGAVYLSTSERVRRVSADGVITTISGTGASGYSGDGGPATKATLKNPIGLAVDTNGVVYVADVFNNCVRRIGKDGVIATFSGTGTAGFSGDGGPAAKAQLNNPNGVTLGSDGAVYIADAGNSRVRRVGLDGVITTFAGAGTAGFSGDGGPAASAALKSPMDVAVGTDGVVYIADAGNRRVRRVSKEGVISTLAGTGTAASSGDGGQASRASLNYPTGLAVGNDGAVYIADAFGHGVRRVSKEGVITTLAGTGVKGFSGDMGVSSRAQLSTPFDVAAGQKGEIYIADTQNHRVRVVGGQGGSGESPSISLSDAVVAFGNTDVGATSQKTFTISNTGSGTLSITGLTLGGTVVSGPEDAAHFKVSPASGSVEAGKALTVTVTFSPTSAGEKYASLRIAHNAAGSPSLVSLNGTGVAVSSPSTGVTPKAGDGTAVLDLDAASGDQSVRTVGGMKAGQKVDVQVVLNKEYAGASGFQVVLKFDTTKVSVAGYRKDGTAFASAIDLPAQVKGDSVTYGASILGGTTTAKGPLAILTFETKAGYSGDTEITLKSVQVRVSGAPSTITPGASVALSSAGGGGGGLASDFDGNGTVDFDDFFAFAGAFGQKGIGSNAKFDLDKDGEVGFGDFFAFAADFGKKAK